MSIEVTVPLLLKEGNNTGLEQNRKKIVFMISENISKATNLGICVQTFNILFPLDANWYESTKK